MTIQIEKVGRRHYLLNTPFAAKDRIKAAGCTWDGERRAWWTGKKATAEALVSELATADLGLAGFPARLDDGSWGVRIPGRPTEVIGRTVKVTARGGRSWTAKVAEITDVEDDAIVVRTIREDSGSRRRSGGRDRVARQAAAATRRSGGNACRDCGGHIQSWSQGASAGLCHDCV